MEHKAFGCGQAAPKNLALKQVDTVMGGNRIDNQKPFLVVNKETANQTIKF
jgi:hypothetical protein